MRWDSCVAASAAASDLGWDCGQCGLGLFGSACLVCDAFEGIIHVSMWGLVAGV